MAMRVNVHEAKTHLSRLIKAALEGEEVILTKAGKPQVKLVPVELPKGKRPLGLFAGAGTWMSDDFNAELTDEEIGGWYSKPLAPEE